MAEPEFSLPPVAFKEWRVVCDAIESGEQCVILRKGGIAEGKVGFQWLHRKFFLFPTLYHEQGNLVRPDRDGIKREAAGESSEDEKIEIALYVEAIFTGRLTRWEEVCELEPYHIWTRECIRERFDWGDEPGISYAVIRASKLLEPWKFENRRGFGGCRSWVDLPLEEVAGSSERLQPISSSQFEYATNCVR